MIKVLINGCTGKMGQVVFNQIQEQDEFTVVAGFAKEDLHNCTFPVYTKIEEIKEIPDVIIDFSIPVSTLSMLEFAKANNIPTVIATTGFSEEQLVRIADYSKVIPIFKSANMSFDINLMAKTLAQLAPTFKNCDIEIIETHHNRKIDAPSGTALLLADSINQSLGNTMTYVFDRHERKEKRQKNEIGFSSIRGGNIVGEHTVQFFGDNETFEIKHTTYSRSVFADGAIAAAKFLINMPNGLYDMKNLV